MTNQPISDAEIEQARADHRKAVELRYAQLPECTAPVRTTTLMTYPLGDFRMDVETHRGLAASMMHWVGEISYCGHSDVGTVRNLIFNQFLSTPFEWLLGVDSDIGFNVDAVRQLLEWQGPRDYAVNGVYAKKHEPEEAVTQGLGFFRVHRCVLEAIALHLPFRYKYEGNELQDFCITGATEKMGMLREDSGFWFLCSQVGVKPRLVAPELEHFGGRRGWRVSETIKRRVNNGKGCEICGQPDHLEMMCPKRV